MGATRRTPKHVVLAGQVRRLIRSRRLGIGQAIPTEQELARTFGCSRGTVRRALDTLVNERLVRRKQGAGHFVARPIDSDRESLFGLILPNILNAEIVRFGQRFNLESMRRGFRVILGVIDNQPVVEKAFINDLARLKVSGLIKFPTTVEVEAELREMIRSLGIPYVIVNDFWTDSQRDPHVIFDETSAVESAVHHLIGLGHRRIGWVDGVDGPRARAIQSFRNALKQYHLTAPDERFLYCAPYEPPPLERYVENPATRPTAIITPYDGIAVRLIAGLKARGISVPAQMSIVNLNGQPFYAASGLDLTCAVPPDEEIVGKAIEILTRFSLDEAVCRYLFRPAFHVGRTTAPPAETAAPVPHGAPA